MAQVGRKLKEPQVPTLSIHPGLEHLWAWGTYRFSGQPVTVPYHHLSKSFCYFGACIEVRWINDLTFDGI